MQPKFARVSAAVKGYLTRRLLKTPKVQEIIHKLSVSQFEIFSHNYIIALDRVIFLAHLAHCQCEMI